MWKDIGMVQSKSSYLLKLPFCVVLMVVNCTDSERTSTNPMVLDLDSWVRKGNTRFGT